MNFMLRNLPAAMAAGFALAVAPAFAGDGGLPAIDSEPFANSGFSAPLAFVQDPQDPLVQYVVQQRGLIRTLVDGELQATNFLNLSGVVSQTGSERGLLGLAFPQEPDDDRFYVNYTDINTGATRVVRYSRDGNNPQIGDPASAEILLTIGQPFSNHNGGNMAFGPDGMLYIGCGDGGSSGDPGNRAQTASTHLGKMLRIDVSGQSGYTIPPDNPFIGNDPLGILDEIWAVGLRNPWRWSFDNPDLGGTGAMLIADVGQNAWEEVNFEPPATGGRNYGWRNREGAHPFNGSVPPLYEPLIDPIHEYSHNEGISITGGYVYRGCALGSDFVGRYFFADLTGRVWSFALDTTGEGAASDLREHTNEIGNLGSVVSFGQDTFGELYVVTFGGNGFSAGVYRIVPVRETEVTGITMVEGFVVSGGEFELGCSEDRHLVTRSGFGDTFIDLHNMTVQVSLQTTVQNPTSFDLTVEESIEEPSGTSQISALDWNTGTFDTLGQFSIGQDDRVHVVAGVSATDYMLGGSMLVQIKHIVFVPFLAFLFDSFIDEVRADVN